MTNNELITLYSELIPAVVKTYCKKKHCYLQPCDLDDTVSEIYLICQQPRFDKYDFNSAEDRNLLFSDIMLQVPKALKKIFSRDESLESNELLESIVAEEKLEPIANEIVHKYFIENYTVNDIVNIHNTIEKNKRINSSKKVFLTKDKVYSILRKFARRVKNEMNGG